MIAEQLQKEVSKVLLSQDRQMKNIINIMLSRGIMIDDVYDILKKKIVIVSKQKYSSNFNDVGELLLRHIAKMLKIGIECISEYIKIDETYLEMLLDVVIKEGIKDYKYNLAKNDIIIEMQLLLKEIGSDGQGSILCKHKQDRVC